MDETTPLSRTLRHRKKSVRLGADAVCNSCGQRDLLTLQGTDPVLCAECRLASVGKPTTERHHPAGRHNDSFTAPLPANPHSVLSDAQYDWPKATMRNPEHDFLRTLAAWLRFFADVFRHLSEQAVGWATTLETYSVHLAMMLGTRWWIDINERGNDGHLDVPADRGAGTHRPHGWQSQEAAKPTETSGG